MTPDPSKQRSSRQKPSQGRTEGRASKGSARQTMGQVINEVIDADKIRTLIDEAMELKGLVRVYCPNCRKSLMAEAKDLSKTIEVLTKLLEQAEGRPQGEEAGGVVLVVERPAYGG